MRRKCNPDVLRARNGSLTGQTINVHGGWYMN